MQQHIQQVHYNDDQGRPAGGFTEAVGLTIVWQSGPLRVGPDRLEPNGAFVETVIAAAVGRLTYYQGTPFACDEHQQALEHLQRALDALAARTARREQAGTEGTHEGN